jgi:phage major head subunit gpT-like protein
MGSPSVSIANTGAFSQLISRDFKKVFFDEFAKQPEEYRSVAKVESMDGAYQREGQIIGFGAMQQIGEGQPIPYENFIQGNEKFIYPDEFGLAFAVTETMWDDDQTGHIKKAFAELGKAAALTREIKFWDLLNSGFVTTKRTGIDGAALFASHTLVGGGTYANYASSASALNYTSLQAAMNVFEKMKNERGNPHPATPKLLIVGPDLRFDAENILKSEYNPDNANSQVNTVGNKGLQFMVCHYLSSTTAWFLVGDKSEHDLRFINRKQLALKQWDEPSKRIAVFQGAMRFQTHFTNWYGTYGNAGA